MTKLILIRILLAPLTAWTLIVLNALDWLLSLALWLALSLPFAILIGKWLNRRARTDTWGDDVARMG